MSACVRGCTRPRHHATACPDGDCPGCEPRQAEHGVLCRSCHYRLVTMLREMPWVWTWLRGHLTPGMAQRNGDYKKPAKINASPAPLNVAVLDAADDIRLGLAAWVECFLDHSGLKGPEDRSVSALAGYLAVHLGSLECAPFIGDLWYEMQTFTSQAHALAPWRAEVRGLHNVPCPECHCSALALHAPSYEGAELQVACRECRLVIPEEEFRRYALLLKYLYDQERQGEKVPA